MPKLMFLVKVTLIGAFFPEIFWVGMYTVEREGASIQDTYISGGNWVTYFKEHTNEIMRFHDVHIYIYI